MIWQKILLVLSNNAYLNEVFSNKVEILEIQLTEEFRIKLDGRKLYILDHTDTILRSFYIVSNMPNEILFPIRAWLKGHKIDISNQDLIKSLRPLFDHLRIDVSQVPSESVSIKTETPVRAYKGKPKNVFVFKIIVLDTTNFMFENFLKYLPIPYEKDEDVLDNVELAYYQPIGLSFKITSIRISRKKLFKLQFWDIDINAIRKTTRKTFYKGTQCFMIFIDTNNDESRELGITLLEEIVTQDISFDLPIVVIMTSPLYRYKTFPLALATKFKYYDKLIYYAETNPNALDMRSVSKILLEILEKISNNQKPYKTPIRL